MLAGMAVSNDDVAEMSPGYDTETDYDDEQRCGEHDHESQA